jgi:pimeloyl-ACP methyl ester carboxylesterase
MPDQLIFLPGASGNTRFWQPVADLLAVPAAKIHLGYPGFGSTPPDSQVRGFDDLVARVVARLDRPTSLIAQSMGGVLAVRAALEKPHLVTHLVLTATSGGIDCARLGGCDWRSDFTAANPTFPTWFSSYQDDLTSAFRTLAIPTLLLWGDADPISPVSVGRHLAELLPHAELHIFSGGDHDMAHAMANEVAPCIAAHLVRT